MTANDKPSTIKLKNSSNRAIEMSRYEIYVDGVHVGWVTRFDREKWWAAYVTAQVADRGLSIQGKCVGEFRRRHEAVEEVFTEADNVRWRWEGELANYHRACWDDDMDLEG